MSLASAPPVELHPSHSVFRAAPVFLLLCALHSAVYRGACGGGLTPEALSLLLSGFLDRSDSVHALCLAAGVLLGLGQAGSVFWVAPSRPERGGGLYGMMAEVEGSGMLTAMFGCWGRAQARAIRLCVQQGPAAAGTSSSCRHGPVLSGACGGRAVRNVWQRYIQEPPEQGTACAWSPAATATSCALVECLVRCLAAPLPLRV